MKYVIIIYSPYLYIKVNHLKELPVKPVIFFRKIVTIYIANSAQFTVHLYSNYYVLSKEGGGNEYVSILQRQNLQIPSKNGTTLPLT